MIIDPFEILPTSTVLATSSVAPIPTVIPHPPHHFEKAGDTGNRTLWVVFVIQLVSSLAIYVMAWRVPAQKRLFHVLTAFITTIATISYYAMATGGGISYHTSRITEHHEKEIPDTHYFVHRQVYWARYIDWLFTTPLLLLDLTLLAGLNGANITVVVFADIIMVLTGLFAGLARQGTTRWGYYTFGVVGYLVVVYQLFWNGRAAVKTKDTKTAAFFTSIAGYTVLLWTAYPIIWGIANGSHILSVDGEILAYAVLDVLAKPVFGFWLLFTHDALASSTVSVGGFWAYGIASEGGIRVGDDDEGA